MSSKMSTMKSVLNNTNIKQTDIDAIVQARHGAAHTILGLRALTSDDCLVISTFMSNANSVAIVDKKKR